MKLTQAQIDCAVEWWKSVLKNPKFDMLGETRGKSIGDEPVAFAEMFATAHHNQPQDNVLDGFAKALQTKLQELPSKSDWFTLSTDYDPCTILDDSYREALGLNFEGHYSGMLTFPWKTVMWFEHGGVQVSYGYGAEAKELLLT